MTISENTYPDPGELIASLAPDRVPDAAEVALARERLEWRRRALTTGARRRSLVTPWRIAGSGIAAAFVLACVIAFTPQGGSAAAAFLAQFRSQQVSAIEVTPQSQADISRSLNALSNLGTVEMPGGGSATTPQDAARAAAGRTQEVSLADASKAVGFALLTPDPATLPAGASKTPTIRVGAGSQFRFTFDKNKARTYFQSTGHPEVNLPDKFDGASLVVTIPSSAILTYSGGQTSRQDLAVVEAGELVVDAQGNVSLPEMRDFLLSLPGLPPAVVSQLRQIQNWNETLPIPVPVDQVHWQSETINGSQGLLLNDNSGVGSAAVWHANGHLFGVAGSIKANDVKRVADSLAVR
jgi:hypothetical protein